MNRNSPMLHAALSYADLGYPVFPCAPGSKRPLTDHGLKDATIDSERIERWWADTPDANVAIRTDGLIVIDVDNDGSAWLGDQDARWQDLAQGPSCQTPRGGRHYWFGQPPGKNWRCTQGRLAEHIDTRADGGYIVVPPSSVNGNSYCWLKGSELDVSPDQLSEPPQWLVEQLDRIANGNTPAPVQCGQEQSIGQGRRNGVLTSLAGSMRRVGMTQAEIAAALYQVNANRCNPPLDSSEVARIVSSVARYCPDRAAAAVIGGSFTQLNELEPVQPLTVRDLLAKYPKLREPVIHDLLRRGETMNIISIPKLGKSWLVTDLALAISSGRMWLESFQTACGNVLILDNELHGETSAARIPQVADARGIPIDTFAERLSVLSLRGQLQDVFSLRPFFESIEPGRYQVIILDAFYRFMPRDMDENDNGTMASLYNHLDSYADSLGCCFVLIHHTTKGNQSAKSVTDVGSGAGSQSRATDTHLILRPHAEPNSVVLDAAVRSWPPVPPRCLRWTFPVWTLARDLDATQLKRERPRKGQDEQKPRKPEVADWTAAKFVESFVTDQPAPKPAIREAARGKPGLSGRRVDDLIDIAESGGLIHKWRVGCSHKVSYATVPQPVVQEASP